MSVNMNVDSYISLPKCVCIYVCVCVRASPLQISEHSGLVTTQQRQRLQAALQALQWCTAKQKQEGQQQQAAAPALVASAATGDMASLTSSSCLQGCGESLPSIVMSTASVLDVCVSA